MLQVNNTEGGFSVEQAYKAWKVVEVENPEEWKEIKGNLGKQRTVCSIIGLEGRIVALYPESEWHEDDKWTEEMILEVFPDNSFILTLKEFEDFIETWCSFIEWQAQFWSNLAASQKDTRDLSTMRLVAMTMGAPKLLQHSKNGKSMYWSPQRSKQIMDALNENFSELKDLNITIWGEVDALEQILKEQGIVTTVLTIKNERIRTDVLTKSVERADALIIASDNDSIVEASMRPVLQKMKNKLIFDACHVYGLNEMKRLGARVMYC